MDLSTTQTGVENHSLSDDIENLSLNENEAVENLNIGGNEEIENLSISDNKPGELKYSNVLVGIHVIGSGIFRPLSTSH